MEHVHLWQFVKLGQRKVGAWGEEKLLKCSCSFGRGFDGWRQQCRLSRRQTMNWSGWSARDHSEHGRCYWSPCLPDGWTPLLHSSSVPGTQHTVISTALHCADLTENVERQDGENRSECVQLDSKGLHVFLLWETSLEVPLLKFKSKATILIIKEFCEEE